MSFKRSHATYEADLFSATVIAPQYVTFGTPLPPTDSLARDDGTYVPLHKQEVRDEKGRRRLHGAFTGGWSAGYFNTVGSKEGWTPSDFVSSRSNRRHHGSNSPGQRPEDYMDEEDRADAEEAKSIQTADTFARFGVTKPNTGLDEGLAELMRAGGNTIGLQLLRKMGWKDGQGIGPRVRRIARLDDTFGNGHNATGSTHFFAPDDINLSQIKQMVGRGGLGYEGQSRSTFAPSSLNLRKPFGVDNKVSGIIAGGAQASVDSDDEDPYAMGPQILYSRIVGSDLAKKKKKKKTKAANAALMSNPNLKEVPLFRSKPPVSRDHLSAKGHAETQSFQGFSFGRGASAELMGVTGTMNQVPQVPPTWAPSATKTLGYRPSGFGSSQEGKTGRNGHDPKTRATLLGENPLPGKSVFEYVSASARDRLIKATGRQDLPRAGAQISNSDSFTGKAIMQSHQSMAPTLEKETAIAALRRGSHGAGPYADDQVKQARYRDFLGYAAGSMEHLPSRPTSMSEEDFVRELHEFCACARLFKPMTGVMATRFTTSSAVIPTSLGSTGQEDQASIGISANVHDSAESAAKLGMYGRMTRSTRAFSPARLLCRRFNIRPLDNVPHDEDQGGAGSIPSIVASKSEINRGSAPRLLVDVASSADLATSEKNPRLDEDLGHSSFIHHSTREDYQHAEHKSESIGIRPDSSRPGQDIFTAIFGDSSGED